MKKNLNYLLYGIALIFILIPVIMKEALGYSLGQPLEGLLLSLGVIFLIIGKLSLIHKKRQKTGESIYMDATIILILVVMLGWMWIKGF